MNVFISGTSSGIGKACAELFLERGHDVWGFDIAEPSVRHEHFHHVTHDVRDTEELAGLPEAEIVINNAGVLEEEDAIDVNLLGNIRFSERFHESPRLHSVLFIASASARNGSEFPLYVVSKSGIVGYMKNLALALASRGITVNSISPGGVITPANQHILDDEELYRQVLAESLLGKWADPEEVAELAYYLTVTNRSITGEDILMDNGEMLRSNFIW